MDQNPGNETEDENDEALDKEEEEEESEEEEEEQESATPVGQAEAAPFDEDLIESADEGSSISRRRRTLSRSYLGAKIGEVKIAVTPWSPYRTRYSFSNRVCANDTTYAACKGAQYGKSPSTCGYKDHGDICRIFINDCAGLGRWLVHAGLGSYGKMTYDAMKSAMRRRVSQRRRNPSGGNGRSFPLATDWYDLFNESETPNVTWSDKSEKPNFPWHPVEKLKYATTGDIIVWSYPNPETRSTTGHLVVVAGEPQHVEHGQYRVLIMDSALSGHSRDDDTRELGGCVKADMDQTDPGYNKCGVGIGSMWFDTDDDDKITGYWWKTPTANVSGKDKVYAIGRFNPEDYFR